MNMKKIMAIVLVLALCFTAVAAIPVSAAEPATAFNTLVLDANHWNPSAFDYAVYDNSIVMGNSNNVDAHYSAVEASAVELVEADDGNYFNITTRNGWDPDLIYRYNGFGNDVYANTAGAEYVYMTVKFDEENLALFQNSKAFSKSVIGDAEYSYDAKTALLLPLGADSGVTFTTWYAALAEVNPDEWTTLKLAVTNGEGAAPDALTKYFKFTFGAQLLADISIKNIRVGTEEAFFGTAGANVSAAPNAGLRFVSNIDLYDIVPDGGELLGYGTLITYGDAYKYGEGDFVKNATIVYGDKNYAVRDIVPSDDEVAVNGTQVSFNASIINVPEELKTTQFAARAYVEYKLGSRTLVEYGKPVVRSVYDAAVSAVNGGAENESVTAALSALTEGVVSAVSLELENGPEYTLNGNNWDPQLVISAASAAVDRYYHYITFDFACADIGTVITNLEAQAGSKGTLDGSDMSYGFASALGIYFNGTNVSNIGVTQYDLLNFFKANADALSEGRTVRAVLPISNSFKVDSVITGIKIMIACKEYANNIAGTALSISDVKLEKAQPLEVALTNGSEYSFSSNAWYPQLNVAVDTVYTSNFHRYLSMDFACSDVDTLIGNITNGSRLDLGGGSFGYGSSAFAIYFTGNDIGDAGVLKDEFKAVLTANRDALANGKTVRLSFYISGDLGTYSKITTVCFMPSHGDAAANIEGITANISNVAFEAQYELEAKALELTNGSEYSFSSNEWYPQLNVAVNSADVGRSPYNYIYMDVSCSDIETLAANITISSRSCSDTGEWSDGGNALKIYFGGTSVSRIGVSYTEFVNVINANKEAMANGDTVTLKFKLTNGDLFVAGSTITTISFMPSHSSAAANINGIVWNISNVYLGDK